MKNITKSVNFVSKERRQVYRTVLET